MHTFFTSFFNKAVKEVSGQFRVVQVIFEVTVPNQTTSLTQALCSRNFQNVKLRLEFVEI